MSLYAGASRSPPFGKDSPTLIGTFMDQQTRPNLIPVAEVAPDFTAVASDGTTVCLSAFQGKKRVVLVFYPADNTPVCTAQLCALRDDWAQFQAEETVVYGVNPANAEKHARFTAK